MEVVALAPDDVTVVDRVRKDLGDLTDLMVSIEAVGQLNPITVRPQGPGSVLVTGARRLEACRRLGRPVLAIVDATFEDVRLALIAERDENTCREPFTWSENVEAGRRLEELERPAAAERQRAGLREGNLPPREDRPVAAGKVTEKVADALGTSRRTYEKAREVVETAKDESAPEPVREAAREAVEEMDRTGKVDGAHQKVREAKAKQTEVEEWTGYVERWSFLSDVPDGDRAEALAGARQLAAMDAREQARRIEPFRRWCQSRTAWAEGEASRELVDKANAAATRALDAVTKLPIAVSEAASRWQDYEPSTDTAHLWPDAIDRAIAALTQLRGLTTQQATLRSVK